METHRGRENVTIRVGLTLLLAVSVLALAAGLSAQRSEEEADLREIMQYRLSLEKLDRALTASRNLLQLMASDPALRAVIEASETGETAEEAEEAEESPEEVASMEEEAETAGQEPKSLSEMVRALEAVHPQVGPAFRAAGMSTREYVVMAMAWMQAGMGLWVKQQGGELPPEASAENVDFLEKNETAVRARQVEFDKLWKAFERLEKRK